VEGNDGVAVGGIRVAVVVSGSDVDGIPLRIDCRAVPDRSPRRSPELDAGLVLLCTPRCLGDRVRLPKLLARRAIESQQAAAKTAALVVRRRSSQFFAGSDRHEEFSFIKGWRTRDSRNRVVIDLLLPDQFSGRCIKCVCIRSLIANERRKSTPCGCLN